MPNNNNNQVGILAMEVYTPRTYIHQSELEAHSGVPAGKYTAGLGQQGLAITGDAEDIHSICLTVVHALLEKYVFLWLFYEWMIVSVWLFRFLKPTFFHSIILFQLI